MIVKAMKLVFTFPVLILAFCLKSASTFNLKCETRSLESKEIFLTSSQRVKENILKIWNCSKSGDSFSGYHPCVHALNLDQYYRDCISDLHKSDFQSNSEFRKAIERCGTFACSNINRQANSRASNAGGTQVVKVELEGFEDKLNYVAISLVLCFIGLIVFVLFMYLRVKYPIKNTLIFEPNATDNATKKSEGSGHEVHEIYNPDAASLFPTYGRLSAI